MIRFGRQLHDDSGGAFDLTVLPLVQLWGFGRAAPRWYQEGIAVFVETWMAGGIGRAQGSYDEMVFRAKVRDSSYIYDVVGLESEGTTIDFQIGANSYLYGTRFISYLAVVYGPEKVVAWVNRTPGSVREGELNEAEYAVSSAKCAL